MVADLFQNVLDSYDKNENHLVVIDDMVTEKKLDEVCKYYIRARKLNVSVAFLTQSYYDTPTKIRKNSTYLVILDLGGSNREIKAILSEWAGELDREILFKMYHDAVNVPLRPFIIKGGKAKPTEKYRKGWKDYYNPDNYAGGVTTVKEVEEIEVKPIIKRGKSRRNQRVLKVDFDSDDSL